LIERAPKAYVPQPLELKHFQYIYVSFEDMDFDEMNQILSRVMDVIMENHGSVSITPPPCLIAYFGLIYLEYDKVDFRIAAVKTILEHCTSKVKIAHGQCTALVGNVGSHRRLQYGAMIPNQKSILEKLMDQPFSTAFEIPKNPS